MILLSNKYSFSNPKISSQYEFLKILKSSVNKDDIKKIAKLRRNNTKDNCSNKEKN